MVASPNNKSSDGDSLVAAKLLQARRLLQTAAVDGWLIISPEGNDPALPLVVGGSAVSRRGFFLITASGRHFAAVGTIDINELERTGGYAEIIPYVGDQHAALAQLFERCNLTNFSRLAINSDPYDPAWGGLSYGRYLWLREVLDEIGYAGQIENARNTLRDLRAVKLDEELDRLRHAAKVTNEVFDEIYASLALGDSELEIRSRFLQVIEDHDVEPTAEGPTVGFGGPGYTTHRAPGNRTAKPGDQLMVDFGVQHAGFASDISRTTYFLKENESEPPAHLRRLFDVHRTALESALARMRPGVQGWEVDAAARQVVRDAGYPEFAHALGHQVGRMGHDGGTLLSPKWERYGPMPYGTLQPGELYTLEPTLITEEGYVCQVEEEILITQGDPEILTRRQTQLLCV